MLPIPGLMSPPYKTRHSRLKDANGSVRRPWVPYRDAGTHFAAPPPPPPPLCNDGANSCRRRADIRRRVLRGRDNPFVGCPETLVGMAFREIPVMSRVVFSRKPGW